METNDTIMRNQAIIYSVAKKILDDAAKKEKEEAAKKENLN
jgi:hypothetical protein